MRYVLVRSRFGSFSKPKRFTKEGKGLSRASSLAFAGLEADLLNLLIEFSVALEEKAQFTDIIYGRRADADRTSHTNYSLEESLQETMQFGVPTKDHADTGSMPCRIIRSW